jgi:spermidine synthase
MNRDGFLLGFLATSGQILLLREIVTAFGGSELLIGTALFGWLLWVALGAWLGGRFAVRLNPVVLFTIGAWLTPCSLGAIRVVSILVTDIPGEIVPLHLAMFISILTVAPVAIVSGWLFPVIANGNRNASRAITIVYFFEGLGAFAAGLVVAVLTGRIIGNVGMGLLVGIAVAATMAVFSSSSRILSAISGIALAAILIGTGAGGAIDRRCDTARYADYTLEQSFDTPYGHQALLSHEGSLTLVTDNVVEATYPNLQNDENLLIPPLVYSPTAGSVLYFGRAEFGLAELAAQFPGLTLTSVDPRDGLNRRLQTLPSGSSPVMRVHDDPVAFLATALPRSYDIVILSSGHLNSYRASRMVTPEVLHLVKRALADSGTLLLTTTYDSDRYVSAQSAELLSIIVNTVKGTFTNVTLWPGNATLILASDKLPLDLPIDTILSRIEQMPYRPEYVNEFYLRERLDQLKQERLAASLSAQWGGNDASRPILASREAWSRARKSATDVRMAEFLLNRPIWLLILPLAILAFFAMTFPVATRQRRSGMFMYFIAGTASLSLELLAFYTFQSTAGSLYTDMSVLIGTFMLGLSLGTYLANRTVGSGIGRLSLFTLAAAAGLFGFTWSMVDPRLALVYHALFLLVTALATGSLFVAATRRYYSNDWGTNRGFGYAVELLGSAAGALLTTTVLLPVIGIIGLLVGLIVLCLLGLFGDLAVSRR